MTIQETKELICELIYEAIADSDYKSSNKICSQESIPEVNPEGINIETPYILSDGRHITLSAKFEWSVE